MTFDVEAARDEVRVVREYIPMSVRRGHVLDTLLAACDEIERLREALREIEEMKREPDIHREAEEMRVIARRALGGGE